MMFVPPARKAARRSPATWRIAASGPSARAYANGSMRASSAGPRQDFPDRRDDVGVGAAAADVAAHLLADVVVGTGVPLGEQSDARADLAGRAVAALEAVVLDERRLERVQAVAVGEALDGRD